MLSLKVSRRPEIEQESAEAFEREIVNSVEAPLIKTSIDIMELVPGETASDEGRVEWREKLGHDQVVEFIKNAQTAVRKSLLTVFFLTTRRGPANQEQYYSTHTSPQTLIALQHAYDISPTFLHRSSFKCLMSYMNDFWVTTKGENQSTRIEGHYALDGDVINNYPMVHFTYDLSNHSTVYFVAHASRGLRQIFRDLDYATLSIPLFIDTCFVGNYLVHEKEANCKRNGIEVYNAEEKLVESSSTVDNSDIRALHGCARVMASDIPNCEETLSFIQNYLPLALKHLENFHGISETQFSYVSSALKSYENFAKLIIARYKSFQKRLDIQINLAFNLRFQRDSEINTRIARDTAKIAVDAQRDSASMITIAAVTMFFLPGTFICAVFSMIFFDIDVENGRSTFTVSPKLWYFFAVTVPLTVAVFLVWIFWTNQRRLTKEKMLKDAEKGDASLEEDDSLEMIPEAISRPVSINNDMGGVNARGRSLKEWQWLQKQWEELKQWKLLKRCRERVKSN